MSSDLHKTALNYLDIEFAIEGLSEKEEVKKIRQLLQEEFMETETWIAHYGNVTVDEAFYTVMVNSIFSKNSNGDSPKEIDAASQAFLELREKREEVLSWIDREKLH